MSSNPTHNPDFSNFLTYETHLATTPSDREQLLVYASGNRVPGIVQTSYYTRALFGMYAQGALRLAGVDAHTKSVERQERRHRVLGEGRGNPSLRADMYVSVGALLHTAMVMADNPDAAAAQFDLLAQTAEGRYSTAYLVPDTVALPKFSGSMQNRRWFPEGVWAEDEGYGGSTFYGPNGTDRDKDILQGYRIHMEMVTEKRLPHYRSAEVFSTAAHYARQGNLRGIGELTLVLYQR